MRFAGDSHGVCAKRIRAGLYYAGLVVVSIEMWANVPVAESRVGPRWCTHAS
jgi:hypothetical protein